MDEPALPEPREFAKASWGSLEFDLLPRVAPLPEILADYRTSPTVLALHNSNAFIKAIAGPSGGGKSVGAFMDGLLRCMLQPADREGVRRLRLACARAT